MTDARKLAADWLLEVPKPTVDDVTKLIDRYYDAGYDDGWAEGALSNYDRGNEDIEYDEYDHTPR